MPGSDPRPCHSCALVGRRDEGVAPPWDDIVRTPGWHLAHAFGTSIEGWLVLVARRHVTALADLTDAESDELGILIRDVSRALRAVLDAPRTYVAQFAEHPDHRHVHVHVIPRATDQPEGLRGPRVFAALGVDEASGVPEDRRSEIAGLLRGWLADHAAAT